MPAGSVIAAVIDLYGTLDAANFPNGIRPPIWLDQAPQEAVDGSQSRPPYVIVRDGGGTEQWDTGTNSVAFESFTIEVYYNLLSDCDAGLTAILFNGAPPVQHAGLAFASLSLASPNQNLSRTVRPKRSQRSYAGLDFQQQRVHKVAQDFSALAGVVG